MFKLQPLTHFLLASGLTFGACTTAAWAQSETLRNEVLRPLQAAQELNRQKKAELALQKFAEIDALSPGSPLEIFTTERLRATVLLAAGQSLEAAKALDKALQTERGTVPERLVLMEHLAQLQYNAKAYPDAAMWAGRYLALGGQREQFRALQAQALYLSGQYLSATEVLQQAVQRDLDARRPPDELSLRMLANAHQQLKSETGYVRALELLVRYYPKPELWTDLVARHMRLNNVPVHLEIDGYRLLQQVGAGPTPARRSSTRSWPSLPVFRPRHARRSSVPNLPLTLKKAEKCKPCLAKPVACNKRTNGSWLKPKTCWPRHAMATRGSIWA